jgi:oxygen-independent coproporphyrinogen-3 oxidase
MQLIKHLYIHVPFCRSKCEYCAFFSAPGNESQMAAYVDATIRKLDQYRLTLDPVTIFFGGGTPSLLPPTLMQHILENIPASRVTEWTIECNPATVSTEKAKLYRDFGINRISLGVQAFDDVLLKTLGRIHTAGQAVETYRLLRVAGFANINLDLMFGLPGQTAAHWRDTLRQAIALAPEHISAYSLTLEEDTPFARRFSDTEGHASAWPPPGNGHVEARPSGAEQNVAMYELAIELLTAAGYRHYEISNFAKPGRECRHNIAYWEGADYLGLGPSAVSTVGNRRWTDGGDEEQLTEPIKCAERVAFGLRMIEGVPGELVRGRWDSAIVQLIEDGLVEWCGDRLRLTHRGLLFADEVATAFV